jgi:hypothetical protein
MFFSEAAPNAPGKQDVQLSSFRDLDITIKDNWNELLVRELQSCWRLGDLHCLLPISAMLGCNFKSVGSAPVNGWIHFLEFPLYCTMSMISLTLISRISAFRKSELWGKRERCMKLRLVGINRLVFSPMVDPELFP